MQVKPVADNESIYVSTKSKSGLDKMAEFEDAKYVIVFEAKELEMVVGFLTIVYMTSGNEAVANQLNKLHTLITERDGDPDDPFIMDMPDKEM